MIWVLLEQCEQQLLRETKGSTVVLNENQVEVLVDVLVVEDVPVQLAALAHPRVNAKQGHSPSYQTATQSRPPRPGHRVNFHCQTEHPSGLGDVPPGREVQACQVLQLAGTASLTQVFVQHLIEFVVS